MMQQWPYGANILIESTSNNINENIGKNFSGPEFITSLTKNTIMEFKFTEINGEVVSISTNLKKSKFTRNSNTRTGTFTLATDSTHPPEGEKPYINICCDNVKVPITFVKENKWYVASVGNDYISIYGQSYPMWVHVAKEITVNWSKPSEPQKIFLEKDTSAGYREIYSCLGKYFYLDKNNKLKQGVTTIWGGGSTMPSKSVIIPSLNGEVGQIYYNNNARGAEKRFFKFFMVGVQVKISDGYTAYKHNTNYYIKGKNRVYDNIGHSPVIDGTYTLESENGFLVLKDDVKDKWNSNFFFKTLKSGKYISPSTSQIYVDYDFGVCGCHDKCRCNDGCNNEHVPTCSNISCNNMYDPGCNDGCDNEDETCDSEYCGNYIPGCTHCGDGCTNEKEEDPCGDGCNNQYDDCDNEYCGDGCNNEHTIPITSKICRQVITPGWQYGVGYLTAPNGLEVAVTVYVDAGTYDLDSEYLEGEIGNEVTIKFTATAEGSYEDDDGVMRPIVGTVEYVSIVYFTPIWEDE